LPSQLHRPWSFLRFMRAHDLLPGSLIPKAGTLRRLFPVGFFSSCAGLITRFPLLKRYSASGKVIAVPCLLCFGINPRHCCQFDRAEIAAGGWDFSSGDFASNAPTHIFADVGGLEEAKNRFRELAQATCRERSSASTVLYRKRQSYSHGPAGHWLTFLAELCWRFKLK